MSYQTTKLLLTGNITDQTREVLVFLSHEANNLWNMAVYQVRQSHFSSCKIRGLEGFLIKMTYFVANSQIKR